MKNKKLPIIIGVVLGVLIIAGLILFLTLRAKKITVTFLDETTTVSELKVKKGETITLPTIRKDGYDFEGWYYENTKLENGVWFDHDVVINARWLKMNAPTMTITYDTDGGVLLESTTIECNTALNLPTPTKEGYKFLNWQDQNEILISNETKLACEDITLKAKWEKVEVKKTEEKKPETKPAETKPTETKPAETKKEYTCPDGFELKDENKCVSMKSPENYCPDGMKYSEKAAVCYTWAGTATKTCKNGGTLITRTNADDLCGYEEITRLTGNVSGCQNEGGTMYNNHCYKRVEYSSTMFNYSCPGLTAYRTATDLGGTQNSGCYTLKQREYGCKNAGEGYTINYSIGKCVKTIDATLK